MLFIAFSFNNASMDLPNYFPIDQNRCRAGLVPGKWKKKQFSVVLQDFGRQGNVDCWGDDPTFRTQRCHDHNNAQLCANLPTLPLMNTPVKVSYPFEDQVVRNLPELPAKIAKFSKSLRQVRGSIKGSTQWTQSFQSAKQKLQDLPPEACKENLDDLLEDLPPSIHQILPVYQQLKQTQICLDHNPSFSGGLLSCVPDHIGNGVRHFLFHARGSGLKRLALTQTWPSKSDLLSSLLVTEREMDCIFQVDAATVSDSVFVATRHKDSWSMFSAPVDFLRDLSGEEFEAEATPFCLASLGELKVPDSGIVATSVCVSPYLAGEGLFSADNGTVTLWSAGGGIVSSMDTQQRFPCPHPWLHAYYSSHPRHVVLADSTAVRMVDQRDGFHSASDLFALPSPLVHQREHITAAQHHGATSPLHTVASSRCVFVLDQRFGGTPVAQWYPDTKGTCMYLASCAYDDAYEGDVDSSRGVVLVGSQFPAEVMAYPVSHGSGQALTMPLTPWRLSKLSDIGDVDRYRCFLDYGEPSLFQERLTASLAGLGVGRGSSPQSLITYQLDCFGEVFYQQYATPDDPRLARKTGIPSKTDEDVPTPVRDHVRTWIRELQKTPSCGPDPHLKSFYLPYSSLHSENSESFHPSDEENLCSLCQEVIETSSDYDHQKRPELLCSWCRLLRHNFPTSDPGRESDGCLSDINGGSMRGSPSLLDGVAPSVESYGTDAYTNVHLKLMGKLPDAELLDLVEEREKQRGETLSELKEKNRERKKRRRREEATRDLRDNSEQQPSEHSVFNTEEHQRQNARIQEILASSQKSDQAFSLPADLFDNQAVSGDENSPPEESFLDGSVDLFSGSVEEERATEMDQSQLLSQDDDDDFFNATSELKFYSPAATAVPLSVRKAQNCASAGDSKVKVEPCSSTPGKTRRSLFSER